MTRLPQSGDRVIGHEPVIPIRLEPTSRGFLQGEFADHDNVPCFIRESSAATVECLWLGRADVPMMIHLTRAQVAALLPHLERFARTGKLESESSPYGYCPHCGAPGANRERRPNGDDTCERGHVYPSSKAVSRK